MGSDANIAIGVEKGDIRVVRHLSAGLLDGPIRGSVLGDSITNGASDHNNNIFGGNCWWVLLSILSGGKLRFVRNAGVPGDVSPRITSRFWDEVAAYKPQVAFLLQGTNDVGATPTPIPQSVTLANDAAFIDACFGLNILPIILALPPRGLSTSPQATIATNTVALNQAKQAQALAKGALFIDIWTPLADPVNLWYADLSLSLDGTHPTVKGATIVANTINTALGTMLPFYGAARSGPWPATYNSVAYSDFGNAVKYGNFTNLVGGGQTADTWTWFGGGTTSKTISLISDPAVRGNWQRVSWSVGDAGSRSGLALLQSQSCDISGFRGKRAAFSGRIRTSLLNETFTLVGAAVAYLSTGDTGYGAIKTLDGNSFMADIASGVFYGEFEVPATATSAQVTLQYNPGTLTFTGALTAATSATLTAGFGQATGSYDLYFSDGSKKTVTLTQGSTAVSWTGAVTATATVSYAVAGTSGTVSADFAELAIFDLRETPGVKGLRNPRPPRRVAKVTANYTATLDDDVILVDATSSAVTVTLPAVGQQSYTNAGLTNYGIGVNGTGLSWTVKKIDSSANAVTVAAGSGDNIEGNASVSLTTQWQKTTVMAVNGNQHVQV